MSEFDLIRSYFANLGPCRLDVGLGVGDDCALLDVPEGRSLAVSMDTLVAGTHFFSDCDPAAIGYKSLAVGLSDLAAMGAEPAWSTLALTLPSPDPVWIREFSAGYARLSNAYGIRLVGGDTTRGPLSVTVQVHGFVPSGSAVRRCGARSGDLVFVSGTLGDAGLALRHLLAGEAVEPDLRRRLEYPTPRVELGRHLLGLATAMIDISDGLAADLSHILAASRVGAELDLARLPLSPQVAEAVAASDDWALPLASGDDYELCFCLPPERAIQARELARELGCPVCQIGVIRPGSGLECRLADGSPLMLDRLGYDHFR
ncbi:thiamine-phosphate kinase [Imhoffiella purpurea]|uniref:Thiamine-monophosphate kinase n=1 Tax=Imhoffiella purpurea TaxID=1249627 RepID=W9VBL1_9GAMM|nr:thiamine-phosphate kinase [Imhoffiella purpurea]EXJ16973.1 Thiamine-monophosphate kinase [Imhoffiella purpurea]